MGVLKPAEEAFKLWNFPKRFDKLWLVTHTVDHDVLMNQSDTLVLCARHDFITVLMEKQFYPDQKIILLAWINFVSVERQSRLLLNLSKMNLLHMN